MKLEKPLEEEEMDLLLEEIPNATSAPPHVPHHPIPMPHAHHHYHHHHHHAPMMPAMHASSDPSSSSSSSSSRSSPLSPVSDEVNAADLLARLHSLHLRGSGPNPNFLSPYRFHYHHPLLRRPYLAGAAAASPGPSRPALYSRDGDTTFILDSRSGPAAAGLKRSEGGGGTNLMKIENLIEIPGYIYHCAKDQSGCRVLQRKLEEGRRQDVDRIFNGIIGHVADLMMNPFGNYLVQKQLDVCTEEQRMRIVINLTQDPSDIIRVSLNTHGTKAVQKLIETLKTQQQIRLVVSALKPGFSQLIKDLNGNHVVQCCLQSLSAEDNKFIFDAAAKHCVDIATHRHGCCVLQRCITYSTGEYRAHLVDEISANGLLLAQDAFGNYVVQFILDLKNPSATANLASQFKGNYVHLSTQKFSSNVVEKCLKLFADTAQARIVCELLAFTRFEMLLQDPYANYVIQSALAHTKGGLHAALVNAIRPHAAALRTSPYCKRIFSRTQLKK